jgi:hypothetical protein
MRLEDLERRYQPYTLDAKAGCGRAGAQVPVAFQVKKRV